MSNMSNPVEVFTISRPETPAPEDPVISDTDNLSRITDRPLAIVYYGENFDPDKDYHVITLDEPHTARKKCAVIAILVSVIFCLLLAALIYTLTKIP
uniref:Uncharacterized protein n=1 Tax=Panagrolaimus superbus TaxID=310955 RepID=A0A914YJ73_9BILA